MISVSTDTRDFALLSLLLLLLFLWPTSTKPQAWILRKSNNGCSFGRHGVLKRDRIPLLKSYRQAFEQICGFPGVFDDDSDASPTLLYQLDSRAWHSMSPPSLWLWDRRCVCWLSWHTFTIIVIVIIIIINLICSLTRKLQHVFKISERIQPKMLWPIKKCIDSPTSRYYIINQYASSLATYFLALII